MYFICNSCVFAPFARVVRLTRVLIVVAIVALIYVSGLERDLRPGYDQGDKFKPLTYHLSYVFSPKNDLFYYRNSLWEIFEPRIYKNKPPKAINFLQTLMLRGLRKTGEKNTWFSRVLESYLYRCGIVSAKPDVGDGHRARVLLPGYLLRWFVLRSETA